MSRYLQSNIEQIHPEVYFLIAVMPFGSTFKIHGIPHETILLQKYDTQIVMATLDKQVLHHFVRNQSKHRTKYDSMYGWQVNQLDFEQLYKTRLFSNKHL